MRYPIRAIVLFTALLPLVAAAQFITPSPHSAAAQRRKAMLVPPPPPQAQPPETVEPLPMPLTPLTPSNLPPQPPVVTYRDGVLTVDSQNSTLGDILVAIHQATGADFDPMPAISERTAAHLSGSATEVVSGLLRGSDFGYVLVSSAEDSTILQKVFLTPTEPAAGARDAAAGTRVTQAKAVLPRPTPAPALPDPPLPPAEPVAAPPADSAVAAAAAVPAPAAAVPASPVVASASKEAAPAPPESPAPADDVQAAATTQQGIALPNPAQFLERVSQQTPDQPQSTVNAAGQYMQELYRLRMQQQGQASAAQPSAAATQP
jgi:hypothetical protein